VLTKEFDWLVVSDGPREFGASHWATSSKFRINLRTRQPKAAQSLAWRDNAAVAVADRSAKGSSDHGGTGGTGEIRITTAIGGEGDVGLAAASRALRGGCRLL